MFAGVSSPEEFSLSHDRHSDNDIAADTRETICDDIIAQPENLAYDGKTPVCHLKKSASKQETGDVGDRTPAQKRVQFPISPPQTSAVTSVASGVSHLSVFLRCDRGMKSPL